MKALQLKLGQLEEEKHTIQYHLQGEQTDKGKQLSLMEGRLLEQEKALKEAQELRASLQTEAAKLDIELKGEQEKTSQLSAEKAVLENELAEKEKTLKSRDGDFAELKGKVGELELKNASLATERDYLKTGTEKTEALSSEIKTQLEVSKAELKRMQEIAAKSEADFNRCREDMLSLIESQKEKITVLETNGADGQVWKLLRYKGVDGYECYINAGSRWSGMEAVEIQRCRWGADGQVWKLLRYRGVDGYGCYINGGSWWSDMEAVKGKSITVAEEKSKNELRTVISDQEIIIERLEQELEAAQETKQLDSSQVSVLEKKLKNAEESLKSSESRLGQVSGRLEQEISARRKLEAELSSLRTTFSQSVEDKLALIKSLESDNAQYRKKLIKLVRDKDTLWHKTDELVTAQKRKSEERWQDNGEVTHCPQCRAEFSLFVRKHHCRLCGRIFCWSCSDYWLDSTLSSKKVRCCKPCYDIQTDSGAAQLSASMINNESDDEDEEEKAEEESGEVTAGGDASHEVSLSDIASSSSVNSGKPAGVGTSSQNQTETDDGKVKQRESKLGHSSDSFDSAADDNEDNIYDHSNDDDKDNDGEGGAAGGESEVEKHRGLEQVSGNIVDDKDATDDSVDDSNFQMVSQEEIEKSMSQYGRERTTSANVPSNMSSSMILSAEELESGEVNQQNEVWVRPGRTFVVPVDIEEKNTVLHWSFTSTPKVDIQESPLLARIQEGIVIITFLLLLQSFTSDRYKEVFIIMSEIPEELPHFPRSFQT
ncbi:fyve and coiled-coil domain-containing protein 1 [Plakobranchus ocellatus]|uniref:Fyve and coiled-coil domain-containing protein 1 n=1 Tax=Plakobranchus ocellatus TaxID=259542 RepID=A0AAV3ZZY1_9GAST|nr:fyve and coiled-coil domain-containing protein 1 [Plakobranchus ocellatus]